MRQIMVKCTIVQKITIYKPEEVFFMTTKIGINGFGRIGRQVLKAIRDYYPETLEVVAFNDIGDIKTMAHLLKYDSTYGRFNGAVEIAGEDLLIDGKAVKVFKETDPANIKWGDLGIDIVIESTGLFTIKNDGVNKKGKTVKGAVNHITAGGAKKVIISAPAEGEDLTVVLGVNEDKYDPAAHHVVSNASCTTNCLAPAAKVVHDKYTIKRAFMTTVHSYTNDQKVLDMPHSDLRRARASGLNIIPTTTGAAKAVALVIPDLKGKFDGYSLRVPTPTVSVVDFTAEIETETTTEELRQAFRDAAASPRLKGILEAVDEPLVSMDFKGSSYSSSVDLPFTSVLGKEKSTFIKVVTWYDNEWGYSCRTADLAALMAKSL
jgi:glyceraldehyde 3-phosphate dehydrogenase